MKKTPSKGTQERTMSGATSSSINTDVVIAGAGPVGLSLALDLGQQNIRVVLLDGELLQQSRDRVRRANAINNRALEYMRRLGVSQDIAAAAFHGGSTNLDVSFVTSLSGYELARFVNAFESSPDVPPPDLSPETYQRVNQIDIESILSSRLRAQKTVVRLSGCRFEQVTQDQSGVAVSARDVTTGNIVAVRGCYLVGCDGGTSTVRKSAGFKLAGEGGLAQNMNVTFVGDGVAKAIVHRPASMYWIVNDDFDGYIGASEDGGRLTLFGVDDAEANAVMADPLRYISAAVGHPVHVTPVSFDRWQTHHLIANSYRMGRVFIAGDAAHMHPPTGGLGMNTGLGDASNLGWKLGAVLKGWAGSSLLGSYDQERRPIGERVVAQSNHQYALPARRYRRHGLDRNDQEGQHLRVLVGQRILEEKATEFYSRGLVLGQTYAASPIVVAEPGPIANPGIVDYVPSAQPGGRLPHRSVDGGSLYDLLAQHHYTLLVADDESLGPETTDMVAMARTLEVPLRLVRLPSEIMRANGARFLLVRPDHHVAWRSDTGFERTILEKVTAWGQSLFSTAAPHDL